MMDSAGARDDDSQHDVVRSVATSGSVGSPIVFDLTPADVRAARRALRKRAYGSNGAHVFIGLGVVLFLNCAMFALQPALRFVRYGLRDQYAWAMVALEILLVGLGAIAILVQLYPRTRRMSVTVRDDGILVNRQPERTSKVSLTPWKHIRNVYVFEDLLVVANGLRMTIIPTRVLSDVAALEAFFAEKLTGDRYLWVGSGRRQVIANTSSR